MPEGKLDVHVLSGRELKNSQTFGRQDPYFIIQLGQKHFVSKVATDAGTKPVWNERFIFEVTDEKKLYITIKNKNTITTDDILGNSEISLEQVFSEGKLDVRPQVITKAGKVRGELQVVLLFEHKHAQAAQPYAAAPYPTPGAYAAPPPPGAYGTPMPPPGYAPPSAYGAPVAPAAYAAPAAPPPTGAPGGHCAPGPYPAAPAPPAAGQPPMGYGYGPPQYPPAQPGGVPPTYPPQMPYGAPGPQPGGYPPASGSYRGLPGNDDGPCV